MDEKVSRQRQLGQRGKGDLKVPPSALSTPFASSATQSVTTPGGCKPLKGSCKGIEKERFSQRILFPGAAEGNSWKPVEASGSEKAMMVPEDKMGGGGVLNYTRIIGVRLMNDTAELHP